MQAGSSTLWAGIRSQKGRAVPDILEEVTALCILLHANHAGLSRQSSGKQAGQGMLADRMTYHDDRQVRGRQKDLLEQDDVRVAERGVGPALVRAQPSDMRKPSRA